MKTAQARIDAACNGSVASIYTVRDMRDDIEELKSALKVFVEVSKDISSGLSFEQLMYLDSCVTNAEKVLKQP